MSKKDKKGKTQSILSFDATYLGNHVLPTQFQPGLDATQFVLPKIVAESKSIEAKVSLTISVYGIKAIRTQFAGVKQKDAVEQSFDGTVSFDFVCNESIFRVAFCADVNKDFCYIVQNKKDGKFTCFAFRCKSKKVAQKVADATALACKKAFHTLALLKGKMTSLEEANSEVIRVQSSSSAPVELVRDIPTHTMIRYVQSLCLYVRLLAVVSVKKQLVELMHVEGYADADEKLKTEMLEMLGVEKNPIAYVEPDLSGPKSPSERTMVRQNDPNEYERTRF
eukprot:m.111122 g.111122  ORF g.111122 m.111122 type:complete len:280 (-) comp28097_c0_seq2:32-871(-)